MIADRVDSLDRYYDTINVLDCIATILFWMSITLSLLIFRLNYHDTLKNIVTIGFIAVTIFYFTVNNFISIYLIPMVENKRRQNLISNSLGIPLDNEKTHKYYNNKVEPSILKLGMNIFENSLFAKKVTLEMVKRERVRMIFYLLIWIISMLLRQTNMSLLSIIAQTLFSSELISKYLKLEFLRIENEKVYNELYNLFLSCKLEENEIVIAKILDNFARYESAKAYSGIKQSSKIFYKINKEVTNEWENIKENLSIM